MKTTKMAVIASLVLASAMVSCKKEKPTDPVNKDLPNAPECSFCPGESLSLDPATMMVNESYAQQVSFFHFGNEEIAPAGVFGRTPSGFYDYHEGMSIDFNLAALPLACTSNKITFAHARNTTNTNDNPSLVNVKFPGTPLIVTIPDSLNFYLTPYGYTAQHFFQPGYVNMNSTGDGFAGVVDSIIITGPEFETVTIGANLFESELRSICISHQ